MFKHLRVKYRRKWLSTLMKCCTSGWNTFIIHYFLNCCFNVTIKIVFDLIHSELCIQDNLGTSLKIKFFLNICMDYICLRSVHIHSTEEGRLVKSITAQIVSFSESKYFKYWRYKYFRKRLTNPCSKINKTRDSMSASLTLGTFVSKGLILGNILTFGVTWCEGKIVLETYYSAFIIFCATFQFYYFHVFYFPYHCLSVKI